MNAKHAKLEQVKSQILAALGHAEAEDGLYFRNLYHLHQVDNRPAVEAELGMIAEALEQLISEGAVHLQQFDDEIVFCAGTRRNGSGG